MQMYALTSVKISYVVGGRLTRELYKTLRRRIIRGSEIDNKQKYNIENHKKTTLDGKLLGPKTCYNIYLALDNRPADEIKRRFQLIAQNLIKVGAEHTNVYYYGLKKLAQPLNKKHEACFISFELDIYPSLIQHIRKKLSQEEHVLRVLVLRDTQKDKSRRVHRDRRLHVRHPYFDTEIFRPHRSRLLNKPGEEFSIAKDK
ncbi:-putative, 30S ribosomal protein S6 [Babesia bigemina]|uniref:-putative, 30S ribosomal protein S6 n=1 Tax=Babesia bigemina TaxID=5866 RepID=A0A061DDL7_BABBI|nr:-putative, 30S ribosomal protein S6 [Babesia bigemina]CDR97529.1 -putative, 30S ribosomal protein S6 [Babesia bigemina]|eukprot:XP_012769715.1 -putative, 30S ribosomal protein S6 [Babesia bigemina]